MATNKDVLVIDGGDTGSDCVGTSLKTEGKNAKTTVDKVFSCGDAQRGASLVVHAIASGRQSAEHTDAFFHMDERVG